MRRALLSGITGFIGTHLARALVGRGVEVHAVIRPGSRIDRVADLVPRVSLHEDDGSIHGLIDLARRVRPEVCFHLATHFVAEHTAADIDLLAESNVAFPMRLAEAAASGGCRRFVNAGTAWQHVEGAPYRPKSLYAATKQAFEDVLRYYAESDRLTVCTLTIFDTYGPDDHRGKLVSTLVRAARSGETLAMGSGHQLIDLLYIDDAVAAFLLAAGGDESMAAYSLSGGHPVTIRELVEVVGRLAGRPVRVEWGKRPDRPNEMLTLWDAGPRLAGWRPEVGLEDGLRRVLDATPE